MVTVFSEAGIPKAGTVALEDASIPWSLILPSEAFMPCSEDLASEAFMPCSEDLPSEAFMPYAELVDAFDGVRVDSCAVAS